MPKVLFLLFLNIMDFCSEAKNSEQFSRIRSSHTDGVNLKLLWSRHSILAKGIMYFLLCF